MRRSSAVLRGVAAMALLTWLAACSGTAMLNMMTPSDGYALKRDIAYGAGTRQMLDVYVPADLKAPAPVLLFLYGGSWQTGSKDDYRWLGQTFAAKGIVTVVADYRLYPALYPDFLKDSAAAVRFVHDNAASWGGDAKRLFLMGHSAGAYNAVMLAASSVYLREAGAEPAWVRGVIGIAGPYDFLPLKSKNLIAIFGGDNVRATQPIDYVDGVRAPMLLVAGMADDTVSPRNTTRMARRLQDNGSEAETILYPGIGHIGIILTFAPGFRGKTSLREDALKFIAAH